MSEQHTDCGNVLQRLADFLDSDFDPALAAELTRHLDECTGCAKARIDDALVRKMRDCTRERAPDELRDRVAARLRPSI